MDATRRIAQAIGHELKGKLSLALYVVAIAFAFLHQWIALVLYVVTALMWFIPDRRIETLEKSWVRRVRCIFYRSDAMNIRLVPRPGCDEKS